MYLCESNPYKVSNDFLEIVSGTSNRISTAYTEATKNLSNDGMKGLKYIENFVKSIEQINAKDGVRDPKIAASKGNLKEYDGYEDIKTVMDFLKGNMGKVKVFQDIITIYDCLEKYQAQYTEGYKNNVRVVMLEYESAVYMLITGLSSVMANNIKVVSTGRKVKIGKGSRKLFGTLDDTISDLAKQMGDKKHGEYLNVMNKAKEEAKISTDDVTTNKEVTESVYMEASVADTLALFQAAASGIGKIGSFAKTAFVSVKNSFFGIIPVIRTCLYFKYKSKANTIIELKSQAQFIRNNVENLKNNDSIDPKKKEAIIRRQEAIADKYERKAEKLRAQLVETEKDVHQAITKENPSMGKTDDDDFVLEGVRVSELFMESEEYDESAIDKLKTKKTLQSDEFKKSFIDAFKDAPRVDLDSIEDDEEDFTESKINDVISDAAFYSAYKKFYDRMKNSKNLRSYTKEEYLKVVHEKYKWLCNQYKLYGNSESETKAEYFARRIGYGQLDDSVPNGFYKDYQYPYTHKKKDYDNKAFKKQHSSD